MAIIELAMSAQEAQTVATGNGQEDVTGLKKPGKFEAVFNKLVRARAIAEMHVATLSDITHDSNNKNVSAPSDDGAAAPATDPEKAKAAKISRPAMSDPAYGQAAIKEEAIAIQTSHPATMDPAFGQAAADEEPTTAQTSHPAAVDPAFGQAARDEQQHRDGAPMKAGVNMDMDMDMWIAKPVAVKLPLARSAAARRRTPEEFRQALLDRVQRIKATENEPEKLHQVLAEFRASIDERMTEFVDIRGVVFDLGCGGPYR
ncbi:hypothetical protein RB595_005211 [Gaeumannomyces hyphopodioides]